MNDLTLSCVAEHIGARLRGAGDITIEGINTLQNAQTGQISFLANPVYKKYLATTKAIAVILKPEDAEAFAGNALIMDNPYAGYAKLTQLFVPTLSTPGNIDSSAVIAGDANIAASVSIGAHALVESGARIGAGVSIGAGCYVGRDVVIGDNSTLYANVTIYQGVAIGRSCIFHSGVVVGADGFGFAPDNKQFIKIHQLGSVCVGDNVELGANTCIDRGALDNTVISNGVKIDNLVQIGHNCKVGENTVISGCTAVAGSVDIGANCMIGGAVGIVGHLSIADGVTITAMTLVTGPIKEAGSYSSGTHYTDTKKWRKSAVRFGQLEALNDRIKVLEKALAKSKQSSPK